MTFLAGQRPTADDLNALATGRIRVELANPITLTSNSTTHLNLDSVVYDDAAFWDDADFQIVIPPGMGGLYVMTASIAYTGNAAGRRGCDIQSSHGRLVSQLIDSGDGTSDTRYTSATMYVLEAGDTIWLDGYQSSGANLNVLGSASNVTHLAASRIQPL